MPSHTPVTRKLSVLEGKLTQSEQRQPWIKTNTADTVFGVVIFLNAGFISIDIQFGTAGFSWILWSVESLFLVIFGIELVLRIAAEHPYYWRFCDAWGIFDSLVTLLGMADAWFFTLYFATDDGSGPNPLSSLTVLRIFRLVRLIRLIRVLRMFNELIVIIHSIATSIKAVAWMCLLLVLIMYTGSILTVMMIGIPLRDSDPDVDQFFGSLGTAFFSHFCVVTLEAWPDIAVAAMKHNRLWVVYFIGMIVLSNFTLVNLMVAAITERIISAASEQENELASFVAESEQFRNTLEVLFETADLDASGAISRKEIRLLMEDSHTHEIMSAFGINVHIPEATLYNIIDMNDDETTTFDEFYHSCMRLCGSKQNLHSVFVQGDICGARKEFHRRMDHLEETLHRMSSSARQQSPPVLPPLPEVAPSAAPSPDPAASAAASWASSAFSTSAFAPGSAPASGSAAGAAGSARALQELAERMERFGQVQQNIYAEVHALKTHAKMQREAQSGPALAPAAGESLAEMAPLFLEKAGQELDGCVTSLFGQQQPQHPGRWNATRPSSPSDSRERAQRHSELRAKTRRELEAEFRAKRGPVPRR